MMPRLSLTTRIIAWLILTLVVLAALLFAVLNLQFRIDPRSLLAGRSGERMMAVGRLVTYELNHSKADQWNDILSRYSDAHEVDFLLVSPKGKIVAGHSVDIPQKIRLRLREPRLNNPPPVPPTESQEPDFLQNPPESTSDNPMAIDDRTDRRRHRRPGFGRNMPIHPLFIEKTNNPKRYWFALRVPVRLDNDKRPLPATLLAVSDKAGGLFFDPTPLLVVALLLVVVSIVLWVPMVRSITRPIRQITDAAKQIAGGRFDIMVPQRRSDEIGDLGRSINEMAQRLDGYLQGRKRFLGDVAHELASPIARIKLGLGILEYRLDGKNKEKVIEATGEVEHLSELIGELLSFTRAEFSPDKVRLHKVNLREVAEKVLAREHVEESDVRIAIDDELTATGETELLTRALANLVRNALRYAGDQGPIEIRGERDTGQVILEVVDNGPGVPEKDIPHLFDAFYRPDTARESATGGTGLGLAIVNTCVQGSGGTVHARNHKPKGFAVTIRLEK